jgi:NitT/TauT family transport system substrate-binding protein
VTWTRRRFLTGSGAALGAVAWRGRARAEAPRAITVAHGVSTVVYVLHVAREKKFFEAEGVAVPSFIVPGGGAKVVQALATGRAMFALGELDQALRLGVKGRDALMVFATDARCAFANLVVRKDLFDRGVTSVEALGDPRLVGRKAVVAATAIGSGTYAYGAAILGAVNAQVEWVSGGASTTMLGGLKAGKFDAIVAFPEWQWAAEEEGFGKTVFDAQDPKAWTRVFGGPTPVTVGYALRETIQTSPDLVQAYVNACYRAQQWIHRAQDEEVVELLHKPYLDGFTRDLVLRSVKYHRALFDWDFTIDEKSYENAMKVWVPLAVDTPVPYAKAVEMAFVRKARAELKS